MFKHFLCFFVDYPVKVIHIHKKIGVLKYANSFRLLEKPSFDNKKMQYSDIIPVSSLSS